MERIGWRKAVEMGMGMRCDVAGGDQVLGCGEEGSVVGRGRGNERGRERQRANPKIPWGLQAGGRAESGRNGRVAVARATLRIRLDGLSKGLGCLPAQDAVLRRGGFGGVRNTERED